MIANMKSTLGSKIEVIENFPKQGVNFLDFSPLLEDKNAFRQMVDEFAKLCEGKMIDKIVGLDARGFILASALAYKLETGLAIMRKKGKLPGDTVSAEYELEYGNAAFEMKKDAVKPGENVLIIDDVLATGGTMGAAVEIVKKLGGNITGIMFLIELESLNGRSKFEGENVESLLTY